MFTEDVEHFAGQFVFDANDNVIKKLDEVRRADGSRSHAAFLSALLAM